LNRRSPRLATIHVCEVIDVMKVFAAVLLAASAALLAEPALCLVASPFAGTWVIKPELTSYSAASLAFKIEKGIYKRTSCATQIETPADGADHLVANEEYFDSIRIRVVDRNRVELTEKKANRATWTGLYTAAPDRRSMTLRFTSFRAPNSVAGELTYARRGDIISGAHAVSGDWLPGKLTKLSASGLTMTFKDTDDGLTMTAADGRSFEAKFDHQDHPLQGDVAGATVRLGRLAANTLQISLQHRGWPVELSRATVAADGQSMTLIEVDQNCHIVTNYTLQKAAD
jgi:hypothetical protein